jgi:uncharacterized repeat protein (TIGR01451 family)
VSVIDTATNTTTATIAVGGAPYGLAANHAGTRVYAADYQSGDIFVIDTATNTVTATVPTAGAPFAMAVDPADTRLYVAQGNTVLVIDTATNAVVATVAVGADPIAVLVAPDGTRVYAVNNAGHSVSVIDPASNLVASTIALAGSPDGAALSPNGTRLYVVDNATGLAVVDPVGGAVTASVPIAEGSGVAVNPAGTKAYVTAFPAAVKVVDLATNTVTDSVGVGSYPANLTVHAAGGYVYTTNTASGDVTVIDAGTDTVVATVPVGSVPYGIVVVGTPQPRPTVTGVTPANGPTAGGNQVIVTGTELAGATAVTFGAGSPATAVSCAPTSCTVTAPAGVAGTVDVRVTTSGGTSPVTPADRYTYDAPTADIAVALAATGVPALLGAHIDYTLTITNTGPATATSTTVTAPLPAPLTPTSRDCPVTGRSVTCTVGPLAGGASVTRAFTVPVGLLSINTSFAVTASRTASAPTDPNPANNAATRTCLVVTSLLINCS